MDFQKVADKENMVDKDSAIGTFKEWGRGII